MRYDDKLSMDLMSPEEVPARLRQIAQAYRESASTLRERWRDKQAGQAWDKIAAKLDVTAGSVDGQFKRHRRIKP
jgi:hypothetical protein